MECRVASVEGRVGMNSRKQRERKVLTPRNRDFQPRGIGTFSPMDRIM